MDKDTPKPEIKDLLKEATDGLLTDETLDAIQATFELQVEAKASLREASALEKQDQAYSAKLEELLEAIDADKTAKLQKVVESVDSNNAKKLKGVITRYNKVLKEDAGVFKESMVKTISNYLEDFLDETVPQAAINEAVNNKRAMAVLSGLRGQLSIGSSLLDESVREAVIDGKTQLEEAAKETSAREQEVSVLKEQLSKTQSNLLLEQRSAELPDKKKAYLKKILGNKSVEFIKENFDYTLKLYDRKETEQLDILREEAMDERIAQDDVPLREALEQVAPAAPKVKGPMNEYMSELERT